MALAHKNFFSAPKQQPQFWLVVDNGMCWYTCNKNTSVREKDSPPCSMHNVMFVLLQWICVYAVHFLFLFVYYCYWDFAILAIANEFVWVCVCIFHSLANGKKVKQKCAIRSWGMDVFYLAIFIIHSNKSFDWISSTCNSHMNAAALVRLFLIFFLGCPFSILLSREFSQWLTHICTHSNVRTHTHVYVWARFDRFYRTKSATTMVSAFNE